MKERWPRVRLGKVLRLCDTSVATSKLNEIMLAGVYSFGRGLFKRGPISASETTYKRFNHLCRDDFVISQPKAWEGAVARVTSEFDGWFLSPVFPTFRAERELLEPAFLEWFCKRERVWLELRGKSKGMGARRESISPEQFLSLEIPLPSLAEQQRIVERIDAVANQVTAARSIKKEVGVERQALYQAILLSDEAPSHVPMRELISMREPDVSVRSDEIYQFAGVYSFGRGVFKGQKKSGMEFAYPKLTTLKTGNFTYPKLMAWEGALGVVPPECDGCVVSTEFPVFEIDENQVLPEVLDIYFRNPRIWPELAGSSTGTNVRRRRLNPRDFLNYRMALPSRKTQLRLRESINAMAPLHALDKQVNAELDAFMPALLDKTFKGDLP